MSIGKQKSMFGKVEIDETYTKKIEAPIYKPRERKPHILELCDRKKMQQLLLDIDNSNVSDEEKDFLKLASQRHLVFNYESIADYYAQADKEMQKLMEDSALVIIDFEKAIELGYVKLCQEVKEQYLTEYGE